MLGLRFRRFATKVRPEPEILLSEYGEMQNLAPLKFNKEPEQRQFRETILIHDNSRVDEIFRTMKQKPQAYFMFHPDLCHYTNARSIFTAIRRRVQDQYFGNPTKAKKKAQKTAFSSCFTANEVFHKNRVVNINMA